MFENIFSKSHIKRRKPKEKIIADHREKNSLVISELISLGCEVEIKHLKVADFLIKGIAIERKTVSDFINSMINKRMVRQKFNIVIRLIVTLVLKNKTHKMYLVLLNKSSNT